ncbi:Ribosomal RNA-processing protein 7 [Grifola frondosa]|uniref:Ribosomal RNA-processing protein 7 n=1 Tax=Grifola frondosa TaxID=5627 RepID=A0A1C7M0N0_GRIFR|nr:Ribosomal RNA-processing protein 7 [Grifola frondosa]
MADEADSDEEMEDVEKKDASEDENGERPRKKRKVHPAPQVVPLPAVLLRTLRRTGRSAHVVFLDDSSLSRALALSSKPRPWPTDTSAPLGLSHYTTLYASLRPPLDVVKAHADSWMKAFEYEEAKKKQQSKYKKGEAIVDEDGFTLVTRGGAYGKTLGGDVGVASIKFQKDQSASGGKGKRARKHKKEKMEKGSFYAFQIHEKKRNELIELKKNWEADKEKVEKMKSSRKFKPY